jgi:hypothetical protein
MSRLFSRYHKNLSKIILIVFVYIIISQSPLLLEISKGFTSPLPYQQALAQQSSININNNNEKKQNDNNNIAEASGYFANNQINNGIVTWIQGGLWDLKIKGLHDNNTDYNKTSNITVKPNMTAVFDANFTMIKPNGSFAHTHSINNFSTNNIIFTGKDVIVTGVADIHSNIGMEFKHVPLTVILVDKVMRLMIDVGKTNWHFASPNEMFGTLIKGIGLDNSNTIKTNNITSKNPNT